MVLVVDDAAFMRLRLKKLLEDKGFEVVEAANGREAVEQYRAHQPDVVLMDITMPEMTGIEALAEIRTADPNAYVIMVSALGQQAMVINAIQAGAKDFIIKPYEPSRVVGAVEKALMARK